MEQRELPKKYKKDFPHSYALGPFPTFELLAHRPEAVRAVYFREDFREQAWNGGTLHILDRARTALFLEGSGVFYFTVPEGVSPEDAAALLLERGA